MIKISIIVPVFNIKQTLLRKCIDSLLSQTLVEVEIILVDDASTLQETKQVLSYYKNHQKIHLINHKINTRQGGARNTGLKVARGQFIGFVDADDYISKDMYKLLYEKAIKDSADVVIGGACDVDINGNTLRNRPIRVEFRYATIVCDKIYRKQMILDNNIYFPENMFSEDWVGRLFILHANIVSVVDKILYYYVKHGSSTMDTSGLYVDIIKAAEMFFKACKSRGFLEKYPDEVRLCYFYMYFEATYRLIMKHEKNYLKILKIMLSIMKDRGVTIYDDSIKKDLRKKFWWEIRLLDKNPKLFKFYVFIKFGRHNKLNLLEQYA